MAPSQYLTRDCVLGISTSTSPALGRKDLVVHAAAEVQARLGPGVKVALGVDGAAAGPRAAAVRDVLPERGGAGNGRLVDLLVLPDVVGGPVAIHGADLGALSRARAVVGVLLDVVLDQGVRRPPVDGNEDGARGGACGAAEGDVPAKRLVSIGYQLRLGRSSQTRIGSVLFERSAYLVVPVLQPLPTTKSPAPEKVTEYPLLAGEKLTEPLVT